MHIISRETSRRAQSRNAILKQLHECFQQTSVHSIASYDGLVSFLQNLWYLSYDSFLLTVSSHHLTTRTVLHEHSPGPKQRRVLCDYRCARCDMPSVQHHRDRNRCCVSACQTRCTTAQKRSNDATSRWQNQ